MLESDLDEGDESRNSDAGTKIIKEEKAANDNAGSSAGTKECIRDKIEETSQFTCSVQMTEIYIPMQDCQLPRSNIVLNEEEENEELLNEENYPAFNSPTAVGISSDAVDPLEVDDEHMFTGDEKVIGNSEMTNDSMTEAIGLSTPDQVLVETTPTSFLLAERNVWVDLNDDCIGSSASVTHIQSKTVASPCWDGTNSMDKDLREGISHNADKVLSNSIPDDGLSDMKHSPASRNSGNGATMTVVGGRRDAPNITDSLRLITVTENRRIGIEAVMENQKEMSYCFIKNPRNGKNSNEKLYYCSHCRYAFNTNDDLIKHMEIHSGTSNLDPNDESSMGKDESFTVPASREESNDSRESSTSETLMGLKRKRRGAMQKVNAPVLEICGGIGERKTAERVGSSDGDGKPYTKNISSKSTTSCTRNLRNDALGGAKGGPFNCSVCNKSFPLRSGLSNHMRSHKERKRYPCTICSKSFASKSRITKHLRTHTDEKPFSCSDCMKSFSFKGNLMRHLRTHTGEKPFSCNYCTKAFTKKENLILHSRVHTGEKPFSCNYCAKTFTEKYNLIKHSLVHTGKRQFTCEICSKSFASKSNITRHMRTHTEEKPFSCSDCMKSFSLKCNLKMHLRTHTGEKPFSCNYCAKAFASKAKLIQHLRVHTGEKPFSCNYCTKTFSRKDKLVQHMHMHTGEKPFSCNYCAKTFTRKNKLVEHSRVHTGEKPFSCNYCTKTFSRKDKLVQHTRTHTA
ncbi:oocyte zinc finger protein XlCOF6-like [Ischnura elegans]|uniref:oocyte zinc finger protein XlCOF6-like n=1 Tax=Ischnura elegans TaxID=197161 RepID=UPI001ED86CED|nr:oocyte zinc finger protein XlCOF6-like [Ischnura elegans]